MDLPLLFLSLGGFFLLATMVSTGIAVMAFSEVPMKPGIVNCPEVRHGGLTPQHVGLQFRDVMVSEPIGDLPAWQVNAGDGRTWAVMLHGRSGDRTSWLDTLPLLAEGGITSLSISVRNDPGAPPSPDGYDHLGLKEWMDLQAGVRFAIMQGARQVLIFARSAGAATTLQFLNRSRYANHVSGVVFDDPVLDWHATLLRNKPKRMPNWAAKLILKVTEFRLGIYWDQLNVFESPPVTQPRMLLMHTRTDAVVPYARSFYFARKFGQEWDGGVSFAPMEGEHGRSREWDAEYHDALIRTWLGMKPVEVEA